MVVSIQSNGVLLQVVKRMKVVAFIEEDTKAIDDPHDDTLVISLLI